MSRVAAIQMASGPNVSANLIEADRLIGRAAAAGAKLVVLPENFAHMGMTEQDKLQVKEVEGRGLIQTFLAEQAVRYGIWIVGGTVPLAAEDPRKVRQACLLFDDKGKRVARYDKVHLFDVHIEETGENYTESETIEPGDRTVVVETPFGKLGLAVCYDLRFPELFRELVAKGAEIITLPSAFTAITGKAHWESLVRARAIENLSYVIAAAQGGYHANGRETHGHSMIVDPWGVVMDRLPRGSGYIVADVDPQRVTRVRRTFPVLSHRRIVCGRA
jgi:nitrilase